VGERLPFRRTPAITFAGGTAGRASHLSSLALKGTLEKLRPGLERAVGPLELRFDATQALAGLLRSDAARAAMAAGGLQPPGD
jgi:hypothetical protein